MKKIVSVVLVLSMLFIMVACGSIAKKVETLEEEIDNEILSFDDAVAEDEENVSESTEEATLDYDWRQFLEEYEAWVDEYIELLKKYNDNPTDMSILADYTEMMSELAEWSSRTEEVSDELEKASPAELAEYSAELARIASKLAQAEY